MSVQDTAWVLDNERTTTGTERLALLAVADGAGDQRGVMRYANVSPAKALHALEALSSAGLIVTSLEDGRYILPR